MSGGSGGAVGGMGGRVIALGTAATARVRD